MRTRALVASGLATLAALPLGGAAAPASRSAGAGPGSASQPVAGAAAPRVQQMVVFRDGRARTQRVSTAATSVQVGRRRCAVGDRTALAALVQSKPGRIRLRDFGACSSRARDASGLFVTAIGGDRNRGQRGWVYKAGRRAASAGAGDLAGPFGNGRLRAGQRVTWFYCVRAADCQRTLEVHAEPASGGIVATVRGYDDAGKGVRVEGASVAAGGLTGLTAADGRVQIALPSGSYRLVARKDGLVRSFAERVEVP